ncbi:hypothetical protein [Alicyclobacillus vulcanalis]|uniref:hypothetical protein n=1 Tax=Alicyclobacillus vulcanalis TaxID=252246 RepID=UPI000970506E|nr:hypothetical protein [Alicyclobacillus vulcanalis]
MITLSLFLCGAGHGRLRRLLLCLSRAFSRPFLPDLLVALPRNVGDRFVSRGDAFQVLRLEQTYDNGPRSPHLQFFGTIVKAIFAGDVAATGTTNTPDAARAHAPIMIRFSSVAVTRID